MREELLEVLEKNSGLCLDNEDERVLLSEALERALLNSCLFLCL